MSDEPELKTAQQKRVLSPLKIAWITVFILLGSIMAWVALSSDPIDQDTVADTVSPPEQIPAETSLTISDLDENIPDTVIDDTINNLQDTPIETIMPPAPENNVSSDEQKLIQSQAPLKTAPNNNLLVTGKNGMLPVLGPDGLIAWQEYARPFSGSDDKPKIALLVMDIGLNSKNSESAINDLPGQVDMAFSPYGRNLQSWMDKAREKGHEGFLMVPTEPLNYPSNDPGPHTLVSDISSRDNLLRLDWVLSQLTGYVGVVNHMGSKFTASEEALTPILEDLKQRGLMIIDSRSTRFSLAARIARRINMPRAVNDRYIDNELSSQAIQSQLTELEKTATTFGAALGLARATPITINEIQKWAFSLESKNIELVPVTAIANRQPIK